MITKIKENWMYLSAIFLIFSVGGWLMETIGNIVFHGSVLDKGFLTLPLCPIYGFAVVIIMIVVGLPFEGKWKDLYIQKTGFSKFAVKSLTLLIYTIVCTITAVAFEFVVGQTYYMIFDIRLWHYQETADTFWNGFISREVSDAWFLLIMIAAPAIVTPLYRKIKTINIVMLRNASKIMIMLLIADFIITVIHIIITGDKINIFNWNI